jgi:DNA-binding PadR family transcriptional regulator
MGYPFKITAATLDVLEVLLSGEEELFGLRIAKATGRQTGSIYPILMRLENCGWVTSKWENDDPDRRGPRRRFYLLDPSCVGKARALIAERRGAAAQARSGFRPGFAGA